MICQICKLNPVKLPMATTCSLECACRLNGDDYNAVYARLNQAVALAKMPCNGRNKGKLNG